MGETCDRQSILKMYGYRGDPISQKLSRIFDMGKAIEKIWQADFRKAGLLLSANVRVPYPGPPQVNGEYDAMLRHATEPNRRVIVEIKSINAEGFKHLPPLTLDPEMNYQGLMACSGFIGSRVRGYMVQIQLYMHVTGVQDGILLFDCKNDQDYNDYYLTLKPEFIALHLDRLQRLDQYRPKFMVPPCTCDGAPAVLCRLHRTEAVSLEDLKKIVADV
jgi:hypothetical protein